MSFDRVGTRTPVRPASGSYPGLREGNKNLKIENLFDELTRLPNRRFFGAEIERLSPVKEPVVICILDSDNLKEVNDENKAHHKGDEMLIAIAQLLKEVFRDSDIVARTGGDEFGAIITLRSTDSNTFINQITERINNKISETNVIRQETGLAPIELSFGFSSTSDTHNIIEAWHEADRQMYLKKETKKGRGPVYQQEFEERLRKIAEGNL